MCSITDRETQVEATVRYHLTPLKMAHIHKTETNAGQDVEKTMYAVGGKVSQYSHHGREDGGSSGNQELPAWAEQCMPAVSATREAEDHLSQGITAAVSCDGATALQSG